jgi:dihydroorotate dehydrogenase electron transfer subunit
MAAVVVNAPVVEHQALSGDCFLLRLRAAEVARHVRPGQFVMVRPARHSSVLLSRPLSVADVGGGAGASGSPATAGTRSAGFPPEGTWTSAAGVRGGEPAGAREAGAELPPDWFDLLIQVRHEGTEVLADLKPGEEVQVTGPLGFGFTVLTDASAHICIAGGVGVAPFPLLARAIRRTGRATPLYCLLGGPNSHRIFLVDRLTSLGARVLTATEDGSAGLRGKVTDLLPQVEREVGGLERVAFYVAGPMGLLEACARLAAERGTRCQLSMEARMGCGLGLCQGCVVKVRDTGGEGWHYRRVCYEGPVMWAEDVIFE